MLRKVSFAYYWKYKLKLLILLLLVITVIMMMASIRKTSQRSLLSLVFLHYKFCSLIPTHLENALNIIYSDIILAAYLEHCKRIPILTVELLFIPL